MNEKVMVNEKLKCILYTIFSNYNNLSKKIYIVLDDSKNSEKMSEDILKKINQNTPYFIKKILANFNNENDNSVLKLKKSNQYLEIVDKNQNTEGESILLDMSSLDFNDIERKCDYEVKFVVDYIFNLDEIGKSRFFKEVEKTIEKDKSKKDNKEESNNNLDINYLYNICISKYMWKDSNDAAKMENWIYNIINPNRLHSDLLEKMIEIINKELNNLNFDSYLRYILSKEENKSLGYISMSSDLYKLLLFEDMLRIDYSDKCTVKIDLDVEYVGKWWSENILPIFKERYSKKDLIDKLELEIKKNEIVDFHGKNFEKLKNEIINEIEKEYENEKELNEDFESEEKVSLESKLKTKKSKSISDLQELIEKTDIKYENNIETLRDYCSDEFIDILENSNDENYSLKDLEQFLEDNKEYFNDKAYIFFEVCVQKQIQKLEQDLLNDICEVKTLKDLKELHDKLLENGEFVKCEDLETIIFRKMETIVKILNLAEINDEENISIANQMYENTSSIELEKYPIAEILICRDINIDLNNVKETIEDLREEVNEIKDTVLKNCMFNCEYYNMNIQINDSENYYTIKFRYIKDLIDYIKLKEGNRLLINLKNIKKTSQYKRRVFNKGNSEIIKEIDNFYSA